MLLSNTECSGCGACYNACPVKAISMITTKEGFKYPIIDSQKCINCKKCEKVCPKENSTCKYQKTEEVYALLGDDDLRLKSSSGGAFTLIAEKILAEKGYICGASFTDDFTKVEHIIISDKKNLYKLQTSKYLQSDIGKIYQEVENLLKDNNKVLFSGTPCQVEGLNNYLGKNYDNLLTVDILCHGTPSPLVWEKYLKKIANGRKVIDVNFRDKRQKGWKQYFLTIKFEDGSEFSQNCKQNLYMKTFLRDISLKSSCQSCKYTNLNRVSDITLGDFWKIQKFDKNLNDNKGTSLVIPNTEKGPRIFNEISKNAIVKKVPVKYAQKGNYVLSRQTKLNSNRASFFENLEKTDILKNMEKHLTNTYYDGIITNLWFTSNFGAILTAYALQQFFFERGKDYRILNWTPNGNMKPAFKDFTNKYLKLSHRINKIEDLAELNNYTDNFAVGSDQVFKDIVIAKRPYLFLYPYTDFSKRRVAFSASFGKDDFCADNEQMQTFSKLFKRFDYISTREDSGVNILQENFGIEAEHILDPVFLVNKQKFVNIADSTDNSKYKNKLVCYVLDRTDNFEKEIMKFAKNNSLEIAYINKNISVEEFLTAIKSSAMFITDSFHGSCFALIFNKNFVCLKNKDRGIARFNSLIKTFDIANHFVENIEEINTAKNLNDIDWQQYNNIVEKEYQKALQWYEKAFESKKTPTPEQIMNEFDFAKNNLAKIKTVENVTLKDRIFSIKKGTVRISVTILGIKIHFKRR